MKIQGGKGGEVHMGWRNALKETVGVTDEEDIVDLTDMEERELLDEKHLCYLENERKLKTESNIAVQDSCV